MLGFMSEYFFTTEEVPGFFAKSRPMEPHTEKDIQYHWIPESKKKILAKRWWTEKELQE